MSASVPPCDHYSAYPDSLPHGPQEAVSCPACDEPIFRSTSFQRGWIWTPARKPTAGADLRACLAWALVTQRRMLMGRIEELEDALDQTNADLSRHRREAA